MWYCQCVLPSQWISHEDSAEPQDSEIDLHIWERSVIEIWRKTEWWLPVYSLKQEAQYYRNLGQIFLSRFRSTYLQVAFEGQDGGIDSFVGKLRKFVETMEEFAYVSCKVIYLVRKVFNIDIFIHAQVHNVGRSLSAPPPAAASAVGLRIDDTLLGGSCYPSRKQGCCIFSVEEEDLSYSFPEMESWGQDGHWTSELPRSICKVTQLELCLTEELECHKRG